MKKLSLNLNELKVESFSTAGTPRAGGTVQAHSGWCGTDTTAQPSDLVVGCSVFNTCEAGCGGSNPNSGWYSCGNGSNCREYTEWVNCTNDYKHCGA